MIVQKKDNRGYTFPNTNKTKPTQPDITGKATVGGVDWNMAAWENKTPDGKTYWSYTFSIPLPTEQQKSPKENVYTTKTPVSSTQVTNHLDDELDAILKSADDDNPFN